MQLNQEVSQSLAGRTSIVTLLPLSLNELKQYNIHLSLNEQLLNGFYPRIYQDKANHLNTYRAYLLTYIERDLRQLIAIKNLSTFQRFLKLCAGRVGQLLNKNSLSNEIGVSSTTVEEWLSILEASHLIIRLQPYFENFGKRVLKSSKLYFTDTGLLCYLLDLHTPNQIDRDPLRGAIFENLVLLELIKTRYNSGYDHQLYFYRDQHQNEVDFIFKHGHELIPIEVKISQTMNLEFFKGIKFFQNLSKTRTSIGYLVYSGNQTQPIGDLHVLNYADASTIVSNKGSEA